jgi:two-component system response regulator VanR
MPRSILLVDDETSILDILATWLEDAGYLTSTATNGYDGLVALNEFQPDLVVTDILMPQMDGYELCRMMRELTPAPIMFLSGLGRETDKTTGFRAGGHDFLTKPVSMSVFLRHVSRLMSQGESNSLPVIDILR